MDELVARLQGRYKRPSSPKERRAGLTGYGIGSETKLDA